MTDVPHSPSPNPEPFDSENKGEPLPRGIQVIHERGWPRWRFRFIAATVMLALASVAVAITDIRAQESFELWAFVIFCFGAICASLAYLDTRNKGHVDWYLILKQGIHWGGALAILWVFYWLQRGFGFSNTQGIAILSITVLTVTTFLAGVHFDPMLIVMSIMLAALAVFNVFLEQYLLLLMIGMFVLIFGYFFGMRFIAKQKAKREAAAAEEHGTPHA